MPSWQGKSRGNQTGYRIFIGILKRFGVMPAYLLLRFVSAYFFLFSWRSSRVIYRYFHDRRGLGAARSLINIYRNNYAFGQTIIDRIVLMSGITNPFHFDFSEENHLRELTDIQKGGLLLSAHVGNWEIAGQLLQRLGTPINIVMFDGEEKQLKEYLDGVTGARLAKLILIKEDLSHIYAISDAFKNNELVCMHADRFLPGNKTMQTDFLGKPAAFPLGPFQLACTFKVPVSFVFAMKESRYGYFFRATAPAIFTDRQEMLRVFAAEMEKNLDNYPLQWYNYYDFWQ